jgi:hypothetical protein
MQIFSKNQIGNWILLDYAAQKQVIIQKIEIIRNKYKLDFDVFEIQINNNSPENFEAWDDYIEWKAFQTFLEEIEEKIDEIKHGNFQVA